MSRVEIYSNKTLSIRISTNGFCFCGYTPSLPDSLQYHFFVPDKERSLASNFGKAIEEVPFIRTGENYNVKAIIECEEYTCLPNEYDSKQDYELHHRLCFPKSDSNIEIAANKLNAQGFTIIFPIERNLYEKIKELNDNRGEEEKLESQIKETYKLDSFIKISNNGISVTVKSEKHDNPLANNIMRTIQSNYDNRWRPISI